MVSPPQRGWSKMQARLLAEVRAFDKRDLRHCEVTRITNLIGEQVIERHPSRNAALSEEEEQRLKLRAQQKLALLNKQAGADRTPVRVVDGVYIGAGAAAKNLKALRKAGITHIVNATTVIPCHFLRANSPEGVGEFSYLSVPVFDDESSDLLQYFDQAVEFIEAGKRAGGALVHCCAGQSRSAALIMAYLISSRNMTTIEAWSAVRKARPSAQPNQGFLKQLAEWERRHRIGFVEDRFPYDLAFRDDVIDERMILPGEDPKRSRSPEDAVESQTPVYAVSKHPSMLSYDPSPTNANLMQVFLSTDTPETL